MLVFKTQTLILHITGWGSYIDIGNFIGRMANYKDIKSVYHSASDFRSFCLQE